MKKLMLILLFVPIVCFSQQTIKGSGSITINASGGSSVFSNSGLDVTGNIKQNGINIPFLPNEYTVCASGCTFSTLKVALDWCNANGTALNPIELKLQSGYIDHSDSCTVNSLAAIMIRGKAGDMTFLRASTGLTGKPFFNLYTTLNFENIYCDGSSLTGYGSGANENCFNIKTSGKTHKFLDVAVYRFNKGFNITSPSSVTLEKINIDSCKRGIIQDIQSAGTSVLNMHKCRITRSSVGVYLKDITAGLFDITDVNFSNTSVDTAMWYDGTNYNYTGYPALRGNRSSGLGYFQKGLDFARADGRDKNIYVASNIGIEDNKPHAQIDYINGTATQAFTAGVWQKVNFTYYPTTSYNKNFSMLKDSLTYLPNYSSDCNFKLDVSIQSTSQPSIIEYGVVKNHNTSVIYGKKGLTIDTNDKSFDISTNGYFPDVVAGDVFSFWIKTVGNETLRLVDLHLFIEAR